MPKHSPSNLGGMCDEEIGWTPNWPRARWSALQVWGGFAPQIPQGSEADEALLSAVPVDPWGHRYEYIQPGRDAAYEVISYGADGREGGTGADRDISSADSSRRTTSGEGL